MDLFSNTEVLDLEQKIPMYAKAYYEGTALISDAEFDRLVDRLRELDPNSKILHTPGWGYVQTGNKVKHKYQIVKSLDKCRTWDEIPDRFKNKDIALSPKLDGLTGVFYYEKGKLVRAVTRGNGQEGKDITDKAKIIVGDEIKDKNFTGGVRGELEIPNTNWEIIKDKYPEAKNARNLCAGWINSKEYDPEEIKLIHFITYKVTGQERSKKLEYMFFDMLDVEGVNVRCYNDEPTKFDVIDWLSYNFEDSIPKVEVRDFNLSSFNNNFMEKVFSKFKEELDYELDGIVISDFDVKYDRKSYSYIYDECAFKFAAEEKETTINNIKWELSRTQRYIPVLEIEPVELSGATVQNVTGNNAKYLLENGLGVGAVISVCRSGEVIPKHTNTLEPADANLPTKCPVCGHNLEWVGVDLKCVNNNCQNIDISCLQQWCETIGETDGFAWLLMKQYLDEFGIQSLADLYDKRIEILDTLNHKVLSITDEKALQFFNKLYKDNIDIEKALISLNIPRLGDKTAKLLSKNTELCRKLIDYAVRQDTTQGDFAVLDDGLLQTVKDATTNSIFENQDKLSNLKYIQDRIVFKDENNAETIKVAVTGSLESMKRSAFEKYIESYGYELSSSIKSCKYLITNNPNSGSSKNKDAQKYGVEIITERAFLNMLNGTDIKPSNTLF